MRYRPLCWAFAVLVLCICFFHFSGWKLWGICSFREDEKAKIEQCRYITGTVSERWKAKDGYTYILRDTEIKTEEEYFYPGKIRITQTEQKFVAGTKIRASGKCVFYKHESNPGGFDKKTYYASEGICCCFTLRNAEITGYDKKFMLMEAAASFRENLNDSYTAVLGKEYGAILSAMITGERGEMDEDTRVNYTVSGLGHLLAISGLHVGVVGMALLRLLILLRIKRSVASVISSCVLLFYSVFTGAHDSTLRAFIMFSVMAGSRCLLRSYDMPSSLSIAGIVLLIIRPQRLFVAGFLLSFAAVGGLAFIYPILSKAFPMKNICYEKGIKYRILNTAYDGLMVWLSVNLATIPVLLYFYNEYAVYGVFANILFVPMTSAVILFGVAGGLLAHVFPSVANTVLFVPSMLVTFQDGAGKIIRRFPQNVLITGKPDAIRILCYTAGLLIILLWLKCYKDRIKKLKLDIKKRKFLIPVCALILMIPIFIRPYHGFEITALDVGQGDCTVITDGSGHVLMIDGGSSSTKKCGKYTILPYLKAVGIEKVDGVFITHDDADHMNGILEIMNMKAEKMTDISIEKLFMPAWMKNNETGVLFEEAAEVCDTEVVYLQKGSIIRSGDVTMKVLFPENNDKYAGNEGSLVTGLMYHGFSALFTGDLEGKAEEDVTKTIGKYNCLKVAHHGSGGATTSSFLSAVDPYVCLISAPEVSVYNHPSPETIKRIEEIGSVWFQTGTLGAISVRYLDGKIRVSSYRR